MPGGFLTLSADGKAPASGIVWASMPRREKDALHNVVPGVLRAYAAYPQSGGDVLEEIWNSDNGTAITSSCTDARASGGSEVGLFAKYAAPTVAEGKVYLATFSHRLAVYGLTPATEVTARAAPLLAFDAALAISAPPAEVAPGSVINVSVVATNRGSTPWRPADGIRLEARNLPDNEWTLVTSPAALTIAQGVPRGGSYTFAFQLKAPAREATYYLGWQLERGGVSATQPMGDRFGDETAEWEVSVVRPECADLRARVQAIVAQTPHGGFPPPSTRKEIESLRKEAESRHCAIRLTAHAGHAH
jgi:hypothetical protein